MNTERFTEGESNERRSARMLTRADYERFLPMVRRIAMRLARRVPSHIGVNDLISCGWMGLTEAFQRANPEMPPNEFEAYASYRVKGAMLDYLRSLDPSAREARNASRRVARTIGTLTKKLGRPPEEAEIASAMGLDEETYRQTLTSIAGSGMARLELVNIDQHEIESPEQPPDEDAGRRMIAAAVADAIELLPPRLQQILALYYQEDCTLREIGAVLGVSESRVCQLHTEAMHRLRAAIGRE